MANLNPPRGQEIGKIRPVLVVQADELTASGSPMVIVLPLTTRVYPAFTRWRITIEPRDRLLKPCQVVIAQPRALDRDRIGEGPLVTLTTGKWRRWKDRCARCWGCGESIAHGSVRRAVPQ